MRSKAPTVSEAVGTRMSVRGFTDRPVEGALIRRVLETPCSGRAVELEAGDELGVIDPMGQQVSDLTAFSRADLAKYLYSGRSIDYAPKLWLTIAMTACSAGQSNNFSYKPIDFRVERAS